MRFNFADSNQSSGMAYYHGIYIMEHRNKALVSKTSVLLLDIKVLPKNLSSSYTKFIYQEVFTWFF
jgi:hypothetical protein